MATKKKAATKKQATVEEPPADDTQTTQSEPEPVALASTTEGSTDDPFASGPVSVARLRRGTRDHDSVRRLQHALRDSGHRVTLSGNYQDRTQEAVAAWQTENGGDVTDGSRLTKDQAKKLLKGYEVSD